ncbi:hypothetical protein TNCV_3841801 [Trichonephila clavipes]|nr:hypothetical protein TNCV_3841801 [Trichonephila clavipes]
MHQLLVTTCRGHKMTELSYTRLQWMTSSKDWKELPPLIPIIQLQFKTPVDEIVQRLEGIIGSRSPDGTILLIRYCKNFFVCCVFEKGEARIIQEYLTELQKFELSLVEFVSLFPSLRG